MKTLNSIKRSERISEYENAKSTKSTKGIKNTKKRPLEDELRQRKLVPVHADRIESRTPLRRFLVDRASSPPPKRAYVKQPAGLTAEELDKWRRHRRVVAQKKYRENNKDKYNETNRLWYQKNKGKMSEYYKKRYQNIKKLKNMARPQSPSSLSEDYPNSQNRAPSNSPGVEVSCRTDISGNRSMERNGRISRHYSGLRLIHIPNSQFQDNAKCEPNNCDIVDIQGASAQQRRVSSSGARLQDDRGGETRGIAETLIQNTTGGIKLMIPIAVAQLLAGFKSRL
jgi:hypothetical protein